MVEGGSQGIVAPGLSASPPLAAPDRPVVALLGVPIEIGASRRGAARGPAALRAAGLAPALAALGLTVRDHGDLSRDDLTSLDRTWLDRPGPPMARHYREIQAWVRALSARAYALADPGVVPVFLGGDHSLSMGSINGIARRCHDEGRPLFVLWLDAHADYNTPETTPSGNMHGMSAAFLCGEPGLDDLLADEPRVPISPDHLALFGTRSIDPLERKLLAARAIERADMPQIAMSGAGALIRALVARVTAAGGLLHVSFDVDFLDPAFAPGAGTTVAGGATVQDAEEVMITLAESGLVRSVDIVELNPLLDRGQRTARLAVELTARLLGAPAASGMAAITSLPAL